MTTRRAYGWLSLREGNTKPPSRSDAWELYSDDSLRNDAAVRTVEMDESDEACGVGSGAGRLIDGEPGNGNSAGEDRADVALCFELWRSSW